MTGALPDFGRLDYPRQSAGNRHSTGTCVRYGAVRQRDRSRFHSLCIIHSAVEIVGLNMVPGAVSVFG